MTNPPSYFNVVRIEPNRSSVAAASANAPPVLGKVPMTVRRIDGMRRRCATDDTSSALREVRRALNDAGRKDAPLRLTLSSLAIGAGTSFVAANLARSFGAAGYRTLLVDGDVRRGGLHRAFGASRRPGLTDYLHGDAGVRQIVRPTPIRGVSLIACGNRMRGAPDLLGSPALIALLSRLETEFDVVLCDSAPFTAGTDPFVLGARTGHLLVVLRSGVSPDLAADAALAMREHVPVDLLGVVITGASRATNAARDLGLLTG